MGHDVTAQRAVGFGTQPLEQIILLKQGGGSTETGAALATNTGSERRLADRSPPSQVVAACRGRGCSMMPARPLEPL